MRKAVAILKRTRDGRAALFEMLESCGMWSRLSADDPISQARLVGKRQVGVDIIESLLTDDDDTLSLMFNERSIKLMSDRKNRAEENDDD